MLYRTTIYRTTILAIAFLLTGRPGWATFFPVTSNNSSSPGSFSVQVNGASSASPGGTVTFLGVAVDAKTTHLGSIITLGLNTFTIDTSGLTTGFTVDGGGLYGATLSSGSGGVIFSGDGILTFTNTGSSTGAFQNSSGGPFSITLLSGTLNVIGNTGTSSNISSIGFYNASGTLPITLSGGTLNITGNTGNGGSNNSSYGFYHNTADTVTTTLSGGIMNVTGNGGSGSNNVGYGFYNNAAGTVNTTLSSGIMNVTGNGGRGSGSNNVGYGFYNNAAGTVNTTLSGGIMNVTGGAIAFKNTGTAGNMPTAVTAGQLFIDNSSYIGNTDTLTISGTGTFSSGVNGVALNGTNLTFSSGTPIHIAAVGVTTEETLIPPTGLPIGSPSQPITLDTGNVALGTNITTLNVTSALLLRSLQGNTYTIIDITGGGLLSGSYGTTQLNSNLSNAYTVAYQHGNDGNVTVTFTSGFVDLTTAYPAGTSTSNNGYAMAIYLESIIGGAGAALAADIDVVDNMLLAGNVAGTQSALLQIQPSQVNATGAASVNNATAFLNTIGGQVQAWLTDRGTSAHPIQATALTSGLSTLEPGRRAAFDQLVIKSLTDSQGIMALANTSMTTPQRLANMNFTNSPEQINRHVEAGRIQIGKANVWVQPYGQLTSQTGDNNGNPSIKTQTGGLVLGADYEVTPNTLVGVLGGTSTTPFTWGSNRGNGNMNSGFGGLYGAWKEGSGFYVEAQTIFGGNAFRTNRNINFSTIDRTASGNHSAFQFTGNLELGYALPVYDWFTCQPFILGDYIVMSESGYTENGANSLNMAIKPKTSQFFQGELGAMIYQTFMVGETLLRPTAELGWMVRTPVGNTANVNGGLVNQPSTLVVTGVNKTYNQIAPGVGLIAQFENGLHTSANVYAECGGGLNIGEVLVRVGYEF